MDWRVTIGNNVRRLRGERNLSQEDLAHQAGLTTGYVSQIERGRRNLSIEALVSLADALGVRPGALWDE